MENREIVFRGHSDDVFCFDNDEADDCGNNRMRIVEVRDGDDYMWVHGQYAKGMDGVWMIGLSVGEDDQLPPWNFNFSVEGYSMVLTIWAPESTTTKLVKK